MTPALAWLLFVAAVAAQSAPLPPRTPQPGTAVEANPNFSGTWSLDRSISTDLSQINLVAASNNTQPNGRQGGVGGFRRRGGLGGSVRQPNRTTPGALTQVEQSRLQALSDEIRTSFDRLVISHHDPSFVVNDARDRTQFFQTTGVTDDNHLGDVTVSSTTHWEDAKLVTTYGLSSRLKVVSTYTLLPKTNQMVVRITIEDSDNRRRTGAEVKLAYNLTPAPSR